jgi:hypothetical protein
VAVELPDPPADLAQRSSAPYKIAFDLAVASLEGQADEIAQTRTRAATALTAATISIAFLAGTAFNQSVDGGDWFVWGFRLYLGACTLAIIVLLPLWKFTFAWSARVIVGWVEDSNDPDSTEVQVVRRASGAAEQFYDANQWRVRVLHTLLWLSFVCLALELACLAWPLIRDLDSL